MGSFVERSGRFLTLNGEQWYFSGSDNFWPTDPYTSVDHGEQLVRAYSELDLNVLRTWAFGENQGGDSFQSAPREYSEAAFEKLDRTIAAARKYNVRLVLTLTDYWPHYGGMRQYEAWSPNLDATFDGSEHPEEAFYTDRFCRELYKDWMETVLTRRNPITGTEYRNEEAIMAFELANEPRAKFVSNDVLHEWFVDMAAHFKSIDDNHLLSTGMEGFYDAEDTSAWPYDGSQGTDYVRNHRIDDIDLCTFHMYPDTWGLSDSTAKEWIREHVRDAHGELGKPVYCGEFGIRDRSKHPGRMNEWYDLFESEEIDGTLIWMIKNERSIDDEEFVIGLDDQETLSVVDSFTQSVHERSGGLPDEPNEPADPGAFVDECTSLDKLAEATNEDALGIDTSNPQFFDRPNGGSNSARITRDETTESVRLGYDLGGGLDAIRVETHRKRTQGGSMTVLESTDGGESFSSVETEHSEFGDVGAGNWVATTHTAKLSTSTDRVAIELGGGNRAWSPQIGRVVIQTGDPDQPDPPADPDAFVDECSDLDQLASSTNSDGLQVDTSNHQSFDRPNGGTNGARLARNEPTDRSRLVYDLGEELEEFRVESHRQTDAGGDVTFLASTDGGESFFPVDTDVQEFGDVGDGNWVARNHRSELSTGTDRLAIELSGGAEAWSPQIGRVVIVAGEPDDPDPPADPDAFVDECRTLSRLVDAADTDRLRVDTTNHQYFDRPNGGTNGSRITREGTTEPARLVFDPDGLLDAVRVESHRHTTVGGEVRLLISTDGGESFTTVDAEQSEFGDVGAGTWIATDHSATLSENVDRLAIELAGGDQPWSPQIGRVVVETSEQEDEPDDPNPPEDPYDPGFPADPDDSSGSIGGDDSLGSDESDDPTSGNGTGGSGNSTTSRYRYGPRKGDETTGPGLFPGSNDSEDSSRSENSDGTDAVPGFGGLLTGAGLLGGAELVRRLGDGTEEETDSGDTSSDQA
jgi:mannan endo-1,4-beta-mannosidase